VAVPPVAVVPDDDAMNRRLGMRERSWQALLFVVVLAGGMVGCASVGSGVNKGGASAKAGLAGTNWRVEDMAGASIVGATLLRLSRATP
jgi:hypothetical protein